MVKALASEGCNVTMHGLGDRQAINSLQDAISKEHSVEVAYNGADLRQPPAIRDMVSQAAKHFGSLDILVNNAGIQVGGWAPAAPPAAGAGAARHRLSNSSSNDRRSSCHHSNQTHMQQRRQQQIQGMLSQHDRVRARLHHHLCKLQENNSGTAISVFSSRA
jgi:NAD(P)-dependent dehydrogenase (short-subunit alcohol dehydrogenase family)